MTAERGFDPHLDPQTFIRANTRLRPVPLVPEVSLYLADEAVPLWKKTEEQLNEEGLPPPFWAFAWAGGQALARYVLDHADCVRGKRVLDLASGSGLVAIAAMKAGAACGDRGRYRCLCARSHRRSMRKQTMSRCAAAATTCSMPQPRTAGTPCLPATSSMSATRRSARLRSCRSRRRCGATVLIGDPGRSYLPKDRLENADRIQRAGDTRTGGQRDQAHSGVDVEV